MAYKGEQLVYGCGEGKTLPRNTPVCLNPECGLMHKGLSDVWFLCCSCGQWHPIADHPKTKNH